MKNNKSNFMYYLFIISLLSWPIIMNLATFLKVIIEYSSNVFVVPIFILLVGIIMVFQLLYGLKMYKTFTEIQKIITMIAVAVAFIPFIFIIYLYIYP